MILSHLSLELSKIPDSSAEVFREERVVVELQAKNTLTISDLKRLIGITNKVFNYEQFASSTRVSPAVLEGAFKKASHYTLNSQGEDYFI